MTQSITRRAIAHVSRSVGPQLKEATFRRMANHFHRNAGDLIHGIHFQASQWGTFAEGSFTINLMVTSEWLFETWSGRKLPANPATALFPVQQRIGTLLPDRRDRWWQITESTELSNIVGEVQDAIVQYGLPFLDAFGGADVLLERVRSGLGLPGLTAPQVLLVHAILAARAGFHAESQGLLKRAAYDAGDSPFAETVRLITQRLGFPPV